jgi:hypothetical protein
MELQEKMDHQDHKDLLVIPDDEEIKEDWETPDILDTKVNKVL